MIQHGILLERHILASDQEECEFAIISEENAYDNSPRLMVFVKNLIGISLCDGEDLPKSRIPMCITGRGCLTRVTRNMDVFVVSH
ncbi:hypothetical protein NDU88_000351 [Pleurodeles waltl]|uniref:Uncharacterized protein n=1 Tax=Pleurodeles waltl TaxID=8319 RepID=A0AAV7N7P5_PLEWA|nr:hypothetical protein NDU88_000351 [Pleurodeles waltl]